MWNIFISEEKAVWITTAMVLCTAFFMSIEYLFSWKRGKFSEETFFAWSVTQSRPGWIYRGWSLGVLNRLFDKNGFGLLIGTRLLLIALAFACMGKSAYLGSCLALLSGISCLLNIRHFQGKDGADESLTVLLFGLTAYYLIGPTLSLRFVGIAFIIAQISLSYFISGYYKIKSKTWRSGRAIQHVLATKIYGQPSLGFLMKNRYLSCLTCWTIVLWELTFPIIFLVAVPLSFSWLVMGVAFHLAMAFIMGLNTFMMSFLSSYPLFFFALYYLSIGR
ncbi:MAG TPA: hypothetical protein VN040_25615 [Pseudosphingobacterium sp.]|nr:hypothetical protein [Pseudosphingobacterium sp.]